MSEYMVEAARHLPEGDSGGDVLMQLAEAYFAYAHDEPAIYHYLFERYDAMDEEHVCQFAKGKSRGPGRTWRWTSSSALPKNRVPS